MIRVLHIFSPDYKRRFGGPTFTWKYNFMNWDDPNVHHYVLDSEKHRIVHTHDAFNFKYPDIQKNASRWERAIWTFSLYRDLARYKTEYDVLHLHVLWWASLLIGLWSKWKKIPAMYESVLLDSDTPGGISKAKFGGVQVWLLRFYKAILAISEYLTEDYRQFGFSENQVFTLVNCVDENLFSPVKSTDEKILLRQKINIPSDSVVLIFVGSVIKRKGVDVLIKAFIEASSSRPDLYLLIIGPKNRNEQPVLDESFVTDLQSLLDQNNLSGRVSFMGLIRDGQKMSEIYRVSDIFVFASNKEGLGNVVLEAMASGLPVVVTQLPVLEKIITHGENGFVVPIGDTNTLRDWILKLSNDEFLSKKIGLNARQYIQEKHGFTAWQAQLVNIYHKLLS